MTVGGAVADPPGLEIVDIKRVSRVPVLYGQSAVSKAANLAPVYIHEEVEVVGEGWKQVDEVSIGPGWRLTSSLEVWRAVADVEDLD